MPQFSYTCDECGDTAVEFRRVTDRNKTKPCLNNRCRGRMRRALLKDLLAVTTDQKNYSREILNDTMGVMPNQVAEARRLSPGINYTDDGQIRLRNGADRKLVQKELAKLF